MNENSSIIKEYLNLIVDVTLQTREKNLIEKMPIYKDYSFEYKQCRVNMKYKGFEKGVNFKRESMLIYFSNCFNLTKIAGRNRRIK